MTIRCCTSRCPIRSRRPRPRSPSGCAGLTTLRAASLCRHPGAIGMWRSNWGAGRPLRHRHQRMANAAVHRLWCRGRSCLRRRYRCLRRKQPGVGRLLRCGGSSAGTAQLAGLGAADRTAMDRRGSRWICRPDLRQFDRHRLGHPIRSAGPPVSDVNRDEIIPVDWPHGLGRLDDVGQRAATR